MRQLVTLRLRVNRKREVDHDQTSVIVIAGATHWALSLQQVQAEALKMLSKKVGISRLAIDTDDDVWQLVSKDTCDIIIDMDPGTHADRHAVQRFRRAMCAVPCAMEKIPTLYIVQKPLPPIFSKPNGQTHDGLDEIINEYYARMKKEYTRQFLTFCSVNGMSEKELQRKLFDDHTECEYLDFDKDFPFISKDQLDDVGQIKNGLDLKRCYHPLRRHPQTIRGIESCLRDHYESLGAADQFCNASDQRSIFEEWQASRPKMTHQDLRSHKRLFRESESLLRFIQKKKRKFPNPTAQEKIRKKEVCRVLKHCVEFGCCPEYGSMKLAHNRKSLRDFLRFCFQHSRPRKLPRIFGDYKAPAKEADVQRCKQMLEKQWAGKLKFDDERCSSCFFAIFAAGYAKGDYNLMLHLVDSYQRDLVHCSITAKPDSLLMDLGAQQHAGSITDWISNDIVRQHFKSAPPTFMLELKQALKDYKENMEHSHELLELNPPADQRVTDDLVDICRYLVCFGQFVARCLPRAERVPTPFVVDCMMTVSNARSRATLRGELMAGLQSELCPSEEANLVAPSDELYVARTVETMTSCFEQLKRQMESTGNCGEHYPKHRRFCVYVHRTAEKKDDDELCIFSPPNNVNQLDTDAHIPQLMREMSAECLIPRPNYHEGTDAAGSAVSTKTDFDTAPLMTFSFHVESTEEIRVYLHFNGQSLRFYPQDIVEVLPKLFNEQNTGIDLERYVNALNMIRDPGFEQFHRHLCERDVDEFPSREYEQFRWHSVWERMSIDGAKALVMGNLAEGLALAARTRDDAIVPEVHATICQYLIGRGF